MPLGLHQKFAELNAPQNAPIGVRTDGGVAPGNVGPPYVFQGDATGGQVPPPFAKNLTPLTPFPTFAPDGTDGGYSGYAAPMFAKQLFGAMAQRVAERNNQLQGLFGGTPYQPPVNIQYPGFMQQQAAFDDLSRWLMQRQLNPTPNLRPYINPNFGRGADWQNQFIDF